MSKRSNSTFSQKFLRRSLSTSQNPKRSTLKQKMTSLKRKASSKRVSKISSSKAFKDMINKYYQTPNEKLDLKLFRSPSRNKGSSYLKVLDCTPQTELSSTQKFSKSKTKFQRKKIEKTLKSKKRHNTSSGSTMNKSKSIWETYNPITDFSTVLKAQKRSQFILKNGFFDRSGDYWQKSNFVKFNNSPKSSTKKGPFHSRTYKSNDRISIYGQKEPKLEFENLLKNFKENLKGNLKVLNGAKSSKSVGKVTAFAVNWISEANRKEIDKVSISLFKSQNLDGGSTNWVYFGLFEAKDKNGSGFSCDFFKENFHKFLRKSSYFGPCTLKAVKSAFIRCQKIYFKCIEKMGKVAEPCSATIVLISGNQIMTV